MIHATLIAALALASPAPDGAFCDTLKQAIAGMPGNYEGLIGKPAREQGSFETSLQIPYGTLVCTIMSDYPGQKHNLYSCVSSKETTTRSGDGRRLADEVGMCVGMTLDERINDIGDPYYVAKLPEAAVVISFDGVSDGTEDQSPKTWYLSLRMFPPKN